MATGNKRYLPVTAKLITSFVLPDRFRAMGVAPVDENKAWLMIFDWPLVLLIDTSGHIHQTGYPVKELKKIREKTSLENMVAAVRVKRLECHSISMDGTGGCLAIITEPTQTSIQHVNQTGTVSTVISGLDRLNIDGIAYISDSETSDKGMILFGDVSKGICSLKWPRNWLSGLFSSPVVDVLFPENKDLLSFAVDRKSDLICVSTLSNKVIVITRQGQKVSEYKPEDTETFINQSVTFDHTGCILVHNKSNSSIFRLSPDGKMIQTIFAEISEDAKICDECKKLQDIPKCRECKDKLIITAVGAYEDIMWVARLTGEIEIYTLQ